VSEKTRLKILVVEDEAEMRRMICTALSMHHYAVVESENGSAGLKALEAGSVDLIILDIVMPEVDGFEFMTKVRTKALNIPVIAMSGNPYKELYAHTANSLGAAFTLLKPFDVSVLMETVRLALAKRASE
jgi:two-component system, OmpR family, response regulator